MLVKDIYKEVSEKINEWKDVVTENMSLVRYINFINMRGFSTLSKLGIVLIISKV